MEIDDNAAMRESHRLEQIGDMVNGHRLRDAFTAEFRQTQGHGHDICSCKADCIYHGRCDECVAIHRGHRDHLPNCLKPIQQALRK